LEALYKGQGNPVAAEMLRNVIGNVTLGGLRWCAVRGALPRFAPRFF